MTKPVAVSFIGAGNLAWHLAPALDNAGYYVKEVYSRDRRNADALVERLYDAEAKTDLDFSSSKSSIFIVAVSDDVIGDIAQEIALPEEAILVHTSGSQPLSVLGYAATPNLGVFYPLQTFTKNKKVEFNSVPIFIESESTVGEKLLMAMAKEIAKGVLYLAQEIMKENALSFEWLKPLISEMITKSLAIGPENAQTGPARRGDLETLDKHMDFLKDDETVSELYKIISQDIVDRYTREL